MILRFLRGLRRWFDRPWHELPWKKSEGPVFPDGVSMTFSIKYDPHNAGQDRLMIEWWDMYGNVVGTPSEVCDE